MDLYGIEKAIQWDLVLLGVGLLVHPECPRTDTVCPLPGAVSPAGLALQRGEPELPSPLFLDEPDEGFPVSLIGLVPSSNPFRGTRRVELPPRAQNNTLLYTCVLGWDCRHRFP